MKNLIAMALAAVLGLGAVNGVEARGRIFVGQVVVGRAYYGPFYAGGFYRATWAHQVWNPIYGQFIYSDPGLTGSYYYSATDRLYFPIDMLAVPPVTVRVVTPQ